MAVGKRNVKIPKDVDPATLTLDDCLKLAGDDPAPAAKAPAKKAATKTATAKTPAKASTVAAKKPTVAKKATSKK